MPVLKNPRWERLAQELAQNKTATEAMQLAGYSDPRNSTRLTKKDVIRRRIEELQSRGAGRAEVSIASLLQELEAAREKASNLDQLSAAVRAIEAKARVSGLLTQKIEVGGPGDFDDCESTADIVDRILQDKIIGYQHGRVIDEKDRQGLIDLLDRNHAEMTAYINAIKARPVAAKRIGHSQSIERRRLGLAQRHITNGQKNRAP